MSEPYDRWRCQFCDGPVTVGPGEFGDEEERTCHRCGKLPPVEERKRLPPATVPLRPCYPCLYCKGKTSVVRFADGRDFDVCRACGRGTEHFPQHDLEMGRTPEPVPEVVVRRRIPVFGGPMDADPQTWDRDAIPVYYCPRNAKHVALLEDMPLQLYVIVGTYHYSRTTLRYEWHETPRPTT